MHSHNTINKIRQICFAVTGLFVAGLVGCGKTGTEVTEPATPEPEASAAKSDAGASDALAKQVVALSDQYVDMYFAYYPESRTIDAMPGAEHDRLNPNSLDALKQQYADEDALWAKVDRINAEDLWGRPEWVTYGILRETLASSRARRVCRMELWSVSHLTGWQVYYPNLADRQPVDSDELRAKALTRWHGLAARVDTEIDNLRSGLELGYSSPKRIVRSVVEQLDNLLGMPVSDSPFSAPASKEVPEDFKQSWLTLVEQEIYPALKKYREFLGGEYLSKAREKISITAHPSGEDCYRASYRSFTTLDRSAQQVFDIGYAAVKANEKLIVEVGQAAFGITDPIAIRERLSGDAENHFTSREQIMEQAKEFVRRSRNVSREWFGVFPKGEMIVEAVPAYEEKMVTASYRSAPEDGSIPARYMINMYQPEQQLLSKGAVTAVHEGYPGHHMQIAIANERSGTHMITKLVGNSGFIEGWARYSEALSDEMGLFKSPYTRIGRLSWPARGMVADAAIHGDIWTVEQAEQFMTDARTFAPGFSGRLVERIAVWPGQLAAYDTGGLEIMALRKEAEQRLGEKFDIRAFHDRVLENGSVTLPMLRRVIEKWVNDQM